MTTAAPRPRPADVAPAHEPLPLLGRSVLLRRLGLTTRVGHADPSGRFSWLVTGACLWIIVGLFVDGWYHINGSGTETFFTPWHGILYSGVGVAVVVHLLEQRKAGGVRPGYAPSLAGGVLVLLAGAVDGAWHTVFGIEADLEALLSPPHLLLITAGTLVFGGPLRAALAHPDRRAGLPAAITAGLGIAGLGFFTQYANPFTQLSPVVDAGLSPDAVELRQVVGVAGLVVWAVLIAGAVVLLHGLTRAPRGSVAIAVALPSAFMCSLQNAWELVPGVLLAGLLAELLAPRLRTAPLAAAAAGLLALSWVVSLGVTADLSWSLELLAGSVASAAAAGYLTAWLAAPRVQAAAA